MFLLLLEPAAVAAVSVCAKKNVSFVTSRSSSRSGLEVNGTGGKQRERIQRQLITVGEQPLLNEPGECNGFLMGTRERLNEPGRCQLACLLASQQNS